MNKNLIILGIVLLLYGMTLGCISKISEVDDLNNIGLGDYNYTGEDINAITFGAIKINKDGNITAYCYTFKDGNQMCGYEDLNSTVHTIVGTPLDTNWATSFNLLDSNLKTTYYTKTDVNNNFVPYVGANKDVNIGVNQLIADKMDTTSATLFDETTKNTPMIDWGGNSNIGNYLPQYPLDWDNLQIDYGGNTLFGWRMIGNSNNMFGGLQTDAISLYNKDRVFMYDGVLVDSSQNNSFDPGTKTFYQSDGATPAMDYATDGLVLLENSDINATAFCFEDDSGCLTTKPTTGASTDTNLETYGIFDSDTNAFITPVRFDSNIDVPSGSLINMPSGSLITDGSYASISPFARALYGNDGGYAHVTWADGYLQIDNGTLDLYDASRLWVENSGYIDFDSLGTGGIQLNGDNYVSFSTNSVITDGTNTSIDPYNRILYASDGNDPILNWNTAGLADFDNTDVNAASYCFNDGSGCLTTKPSTGGLSEADANGWYVKQRDETGVLSVDSNLRKLYASDGTTVQVDYNYVGGLSLNGAGTPVQSSIFGGQDAGLNAVNATGSNFFGDNAGNGATNATESNFIGSSSGVNATDATYSNFFGYLAGNGATNALKSNFTGFYAGASATDATYSNFFGYQAGVSAGDAAYSNFFGYNAGYGQSSANNSVFIGTNAGNNNNAIAKTDFTNNLIIDQSVLTTNSARASADAIRKNAMLFGTFADTSADQNLYINAYLTIKHDTNAKDINANKYCWNDGSGCLSTKPLIGTDTNLETYGIFDSDTNAFITPVRFDANINVPSGSLITDGSYASIDPYGRQLYSELDSVNYKFNWSGKDLQLNGIDGYEGDEETMVGGVIDAWGGDGRNNNSGTAGDGGGVTVIGGYAGTSIITTVGAAVGATGGFFAGYGNTGGSISTTTTSQITAGTGGIARLQSGSGGAATGVTSGKHIGGAGGTVQLAPGAGGIARDGNGQLQGGNAGSVQVNGGTGGNANGGTTATGGDGSDVAFYGGTGGIGYDCSGTATGGKGGDLYFSTGQGGSAYGGATNINGGGGDMLFTAQIAGLSGGTGGINGKISFSVDGSTLMTLKDSNVGIGTATPKNKLNIVGDINATTNIFGNYIRLTTDVNALNFCFNDGSGCLTTKPSTGSSTDTNWQTSYNLLDSNLRSQYHLVIGGEHYIDVNYNSATGYTPSMTQNNYTQMINLSTDTNNGIALMDSNIIISRTGLYEIYWINTINPGSQNRMQADIFINHSNMKVKCGGGGVENDSANQTRATDQGQCLINLTAGDKITLKLVNFDDADDATIHRTFIKVKEM